MSDIEDTLSRMKRNPTGIRFDELRKICDYFFGKPRQTGSSHRVYKMPWQGNPRINIQNSKGMAKPYQVRQVLRALDRLEAES